MTIEVNNNEECPYCGTELKYGEDFTFGVCEACLDKEYEDELDAKEFNKQKRSKKMLG